MGPERVLRAGTYGDPPDLHSCLAPALVRGLPTTEDADLVERENRATTELQACSPLEISEPMPMVQIDIAYQGQLRCEASHAPSSTVLVTDAPLDNQGRGESFSPTDLLATALGTCMLTIMGIAAEKREWDLAGASARVIKHMVADPARRVGRLEVSIQVPGSFDGRQREVLVAAAKSCPVANSIGDSLVVDLSFDWAK